jgi:hypothetical protein
MYRGEWQYLVDRFTLNDRYLGRLIPIITETFTSELKLKEVSAALFVNICGPYMVYWFVAVQSPAY